MAKRRPLTKEEKTLTEKNLVAQKDSLKELQWKRKVVELDLEEGLFIKYKAAQREQRKYLAMIEQELKDTEFAIKAAEEQIKKGVVVKEEK